MTELIFCCSWWNFGDHVVFVGRHPVRARNLVPVDVEGVRENAAQRFIGIGDPPRVRRPRPAAAFRRRRSLSWNSRGGRSNRRDLEFGRYRGLAKGSLGGQKKNAGQGY